MQLDIAAYGWQHEYWASLYPPDMPAQWCLDFYANEFLAMVLPAGVIEACDDAELREWFADAPERFRFYWELENPAQAQRLLAFVQQYGRPASLAGYLWQGDDGQEGLLTALNGYLPGNRAPDGLMVLGIDEAPDLVAVKQQILQWQREGRQQCLIVIRPHPNAPGTLRQLQTLGILLNG